jgi:ubiquinone/menaquinone biosynthesis C-methylase UbiE
MKDIVENRKRISFARKLKLAGLAVKENGVWWCVLLLTYYLSSTVAHRVFAAMDRLRRIRDIPGMNSKALNKEIWEAWNWSDAGEEWSQSEAWKQSLVRCVLRRHVPENSSIVEIGPGAGRWTEPLLERAREYVGIDISSTCISHCLGRFGADPRVRFAVGSGHDLAGVADQSIDVIWSFDVFVHINRAEVDGYAGDFARVLRPGGVAIIHHGAIGGASGGWRSNLTAAAFYEILRRHDLLMEESFAHWVDADAVHQLAYGDLITVLRKRPAAESFNLNEAE